MKVGDLVRFTKAHSSRPGWEYCATWTGVVFQDPNDLPEMYKIYWTTQHGSHIGEWRESDEWRGLEKVNESR